MELTFEKIKYHPMGIGFQTTAKNIPAGAPLFWLLLSGIPGLFLILLRESIIVFIAKKKYMDKEFNISIWCHHGSNGQAASVWTME